MVEQVKISLVSLSQIEPRIVIDCSLTISSKLPSTIYFQHPEIGTHKFNGIDLYETFYELKKFLESIGWNILCNGSRRNACTSNFLRQMSGGEDVYLVELGESADPDNTVYIFDVAKIEQIATLEEQEKFYGQWLNSTA